MKFLLCVVCGKPVKFRKFNLGYCKTCSHSCKTKNPEAKNKLNKTVDRLNKEDPNRINKIKEKIINTFKKHLLDGTINKQHSTATTIYLSKNEKSLYEILIELYGKNDIIIHYHDIRYSRPFDKYPWECDFYIKSLDLFIECQGFISHGPHPYNKKSKEDKKILQDLKNKYKTTNSKFYKSAIYVWCHLDPIKRSIAAKNNLNYIEIFGNIYDKNSIKKIIDDYFK